MMRDMEEDGVVHGARAVPAPRPPAARPHAVEQAEAAGARQVLGGAAAGRRQDARRAGDRAATTAAPPSSLGPNTAIQAQWLRGWERPDR